MYNEKNIVKKVLLMARFNEGGMHYVYYHRRDKEFDDDINFISIPTKKIKPKQAEIISYKGKMYQVVSVDEDGNKRVIPYNIRKKKKKKRKQPNQQN